MTASRLDTCAFAFMGFLGFCFTTGILLGVSSDRPAHAQGKPYDEFDTTWAHCVLVKDGGYNGNSPALACIPKAP
jgi:hypothetical protein